MFHIRVLDLEMVAIDLFKNLFHFAWLPKYADFRQQFRVSNRRLKEISFLEVHFKMGNCLKCIKKKKM